MSRPDPRTSRQAVLGLAGVLALVLITRVCWGLFTQEYESADRVTVRGDRVGLLAEVNAPVKYRGVVVGRVRSVDTDGGTAVVGLALDPDRIGSIPADVRAHLQPLTVLGSKYVDLVPPADPGTARLQAGAVIEDADVADEFNQAFSEVMSALDALEPARLNAALFAVAGALDGNGARLGRIIADGREVVGALEDRAPTLLSDLRRARSVVDSYAAVTPDFLTTLRAGASVSEALVAQRDLLAGFLGSLTALGYDMTSFVEAVQGPLGSTAATLRPALELLGRYSPEIPCLLEGTAKNAKRFVKIMGGPAKGGKHRNVQVTFTVGRGQPAYRFPEDLPKVAATGGPACHGLPNVTTPPPFIVNDVGANPYPSLSDGSVPPDVPLGLWLFGQQFELGAKR